MTSGSVVPVNKRINEIRPPGGAPHQGAGPRSKTGHRGATTRSQVEPQLTARRLLRGGGCSTGQPRSGQVPEPLHIPPLVYQHRVGANLQCQSQRSRLTWIKPFGPKLVRHTGARLLAQPGGQSQAGESRADHRQATEFVRNLMGNDNFMEQLRKELRLTNTAEVENDGSIRDDNHRSRFRVSMSSCSISIVNAGNCRSPSAR